jgi:hypothetical protein
MKARKKRTQRKCVQFSRPPLAWEKCAGRPLTALTAMTVKNEAMS